MASSEVFLKMYTCHANVSKDQITALSLTSKHISDYFSAPAVLFFYPPETSELSLQRRALDTSLSCSNCSVPVPVRLSLGSAHISAGDPPALLDNGSDISGMMSVRCSILPKMPLIGSLAQSHISILGLPFQPDERFREEPITSVLRVSQTKR